MFFSSFLIFMITLVAGMIVSSNCSLFLVFHMWVSIGVASVRVSFIFLVVVTKMILSGYVVMVFSFSNSQCKDELYSLFCHIICNLGISDVFDLSIYIFDH